MTEQRGKEAKGDPSPLLMAISELMALRALELAGKRIPSRRGGRSLWDRYKDVPPWEIHTIFPVRPEELDKILANAWAIPLRIGVPTSLVEALDMHVRALLIAGRAFDRTDLRLTLSRTSFDDTKLPWVKGASIE
jgi:hypothetical protein